MPGATNDELAHFGMVCHRTGLDPFARQIYAIKRKKKIDGKEIFFYSPEVAIDGFRATAEKTGAYAGNDDPIFDNEANPTKATVTVYKLVSGTRCPFTASARWDQYCPKEENKAFMWRKMPHVMLGKCAEALALRKAFPQQLSGVYTEDEMAQADNQSHRPSEPFIDKENGQILIEAESTPTKQAHISAHAEKVFNEIIDKLIDITSANGNDMEDILEWASEWRDKGIVRKKGARTPNTLSYEPNPKAEGRSQADWALIKLKSLTKESCKKTLNEWKK